MSMQSGKTIGVLLCWVTGLAGIVDADDSRWVEPYHQYRIPVEVMVEQSGWSVLSITEEEISSAIGRLEEYAFEPMFFAYNQLKMVEVDASGKVLRGSLRGGFCLVTDGRELALLDASFPNYDV